MPRKPVPIIIFISRIFFIILLSVCTQLCWAQGKSTDNMVLTLNPRIYQELVPSTGLFNSNSGFTFDRGYFIKHEPISGYDIWETIELSRSLGDSSVKRKNQQYKTDDMIVRKEFNQKSVPYLLTPHRYNSFEDSLFLWNAEYPYIYHVDISTTVDDNTFEKIRLKQGLKYYSVINGVSHLNGRKITLKPVLYPSNRSDQDKHNDLLELRRNYVNTVIISEYDTTLLQLCDKIGLYAILKHSANMDGYLNSLDSCKSLMDKMNWMNRIIFQNKGGGNPFRFGSLLYITTDSEDKKLLKELNSLLSFYNRNANNLYTNSSVGALKIERKYNFDSFIHGNRNRFVDSLRNEYIPVDIDTLTGEIGKIRLSNNFDFANLSEYKMNFVLSVGDEKISENDVNLSSIKPGSGSSIKVFEQEKITKMNTQYTLNVTLELLKQSSTLQKEIALKPIHFCMSEKP